MIFLGDRYRPRGIICNYHRYNGVHSHHVFLFNKILKVLLVLLESHVGF